MEKLSKIFFRPRFSILGQHTFDEKKVKFQTVEDEPKEDPPKPRKSVKKRTSSILNEPKSRFELLSERNRAASYIRYFGKARKSSTTTRKSSTKTRGSSTSLRSSSTSIRSSSTSIRSSSTSIRRTLLEDYSDDRILPIRVSKSALNYIATPRIIELATPRHSSKDINYRPLPAKVSTAALQYEPSKRIKKLAKPIKRPMSADSGPEEVKMTTVKKKWRNSKIKRVPRKAPPLPMIIDEPWERRIYEPVVKVNPLALKYRPSERIKQLAMPTERDEGIHEPSLPLEVNAAALNYEATERIKHLATPKKRAKGTVRQRSMPSKVSRVALKYTASPRIKELANPRLKPDVIFYTAEHKKQFPEQFISPLKVQPRVINIKPRSRISELAIPKDRPDYQGDLMLPRPIKESTMNYVASKRIKQLALPKGTKQPKPPNPAKAKVFEHIYKLATPRKSRQQFFPQPLPAKISQGALNYKATPRIIELAKPKTYPTFVNHEVKDPFKISPKALKARPSQRLLFLSQPRQLRFVKTPQPSIDELDFENDMK